VPTIETAAGKIFYAEKENPFSKLPPLVLVHGAGADHVVWSAEIRRLPDVRVIALDLPGHGRSTPPGRQTIIAYAESVGQLLKALNIACAIIAGHSMGGAIAQAMGVYMKTQVAGLILIGTGARLKVNPKILTTVQQDPEAVADMITRWEWAPGIDERMRHLSKRQLLAIDPQVIYGDYLACDTFIIEDQLSSITAPTLIIGGTADKMTPFAMSQALAAQIANSTLVRIEGGGHKMFLEQRQLVADHITHWLRSLDR
jgi:pimeloyl-ACP methyl ester carboxylesterase